MPCTCPHARGARLYRNLADICCSRNANRFTVSQDRRELALYAFSVVTIIFLPLSTVAGIFGMNTNDIRNLDQDQWLFWAVATPISILIVLGLFWAGELSNAWSGFLDFLLRRGRSDTRVRSLILRRSTDRSDYESYNSSSQETEYDPQEPRLYRRRPLRRGTDRDG